MTTGPRERMAEPRRLAAVALIVDVVASTRSGATTWRELGTLLHERYVTDSAGDGDPSRPGSDGQLIPLRFTLRDGWASQQLRDHVADACALEALEAGRGGVLTLGSMAANYASLEEATLTDTSQPPTRSRKRRLVGVTDRSGTNGR